MRKRLRFGFEILVALLAASPARAGLPDRFDDLRPTIDGLLRSELTGRWYPAAVDRERGGFHQNFARDWTRRRDDGRSIVYQARMTWTAAAFAAYAPEKREEFLSYARHGVKYLDEVLRDRELGGFHWIVGVDGRVDPKLGDEKHVYGTAFALYAASEAYRVGHDPAALRVARDAFSWLETQAHDAEHGGYFEALTRDGRPIRGGPGADRLGIAYGYKTMNSHIHLLEAVAAFARIEPTEKVKERLAELLAIVRDKIAIEPGALSLYLTRDWRAVPAHDSFGHDVETAYLLVEAAVVLGIPDDPKTWRMARMLVDHALDRGWDDQLGGFYDKGDAVGAQAYDTTKVWWTQAEGLNALDMMNRRFGDGTDRYAEAFRKQWAFITAHQIDKEHGGWFGETTREGRLLGDGAKATPWKANYHTGRAMMNVGRAVAKP